MDPLVATIVPHLTCRALAFDRRTFGAEVPCVQNLPDGRAMHAASIGFER